MTDEVSVPVNPRLEDPQDIIDTLKDIAKKLGFRETRVDEMTSRQGAVIAIGYGIGEVTLTLKSQHRHGEVTKFRIFKEPSLETYSMFRDVLRGHAKRGSE